MNPSSEPVIHSGEVDVSKRGAGINPSVIHSGKFETLNERAGMKP